MFETLPAPDRRVLVVRNTASRASVQITEHYLNARGLRLVADVRVPDSAKATQWETIRWEDFRDKIQLPLERALAVLPEVDYLVLTKGVPIRIDGMPGLGWKNRQPSVDCALAATGYAGLLGSRTVRLGFGRERGTAWLNRYFNAMTPFVHRLYGGYAVCRLDGYTPENAMALVDRGIESERKSPEGCFLFDCDPTRGFARRGGEVIHPTYEAMNLQMCEAACELALRKLPVELNVDKEFWVPTKPLAGYCSWGSNDRNFNADRYAELRFAPGAIAETAVSTSGRTFLPTRGGQSLIADLIAQGVTGIKGYTDEPFIDGIASPGILFHRYTSGFHLGDSFWAASRYVGWQDVVIGDPLCRPWGRG